MANLGLFIFLVCAYQISALGPEELVVVVISQSDDYHSTLAQELKENIMEQSFTLGKKAPEIYLTHEDFPHPGAWTFFPIFPFLDQTIGSRNISWAIFCEERTRLNLEKLMYILSLYDPTKEIWLGHGLHDTKQTIVHHFHFPPEPMPYPLMASGFAISVAMLNRLSKTQITPKHLFSIDARYELAWNINDTYMISLPSVFCLENNHTDCATYPLPHILWGEPVPNEDIYFAVKTCHKYHQGRVRVVQMTWGKEASNIEFFSDVQDDSIPTTPVGVVNTEIGHCSKTKVILETMAERIRTMPNLQWIVLADDDTLLSVPRLRLLLSSLSGHAVVVGERYGYLAYNSSGYNFPAAGAGMAINVAVLPKLLRRFRCYVDNSPDDMIIGMFLNRLEIPIIHFTHFHQARPRDYPAEYLALEEPISFHKFWEVDPLTIYEQWFSMPVPKHSPDTHTEL